MADDEKAGKHDSGQTSDSNTAGHGGRHSQRPESGPLGSRLDGPHHPDGWHTDLRE